MSNLSFHDCNRIRNADDLCAFILALRRDFVENDAEWENVNLDDYLEAMATWLSDSGRAERVPPPALQLFATALFAASRYE